MVLGQLPPRKMPPTPKLTLIQTLTIFLRGNCLVAPNPKINLNLDQNSNPNRGAIFFGGQLSG